MRTSNSSLTAAGIALVRAVESQKPDDERICYDPYARQFVPSWMYYLFGFFIRSGYGEIRGPGVNGYLVARERYIDDVMQSFLDRGIQQLVILGAGYDSRAYRSNVTGLERIFEIDHPATQADKLKRVKSVFGKAPEWVSYVPIDFNSQTLEERLLACGYDESLTTLFIWQGVTMYLTSEAVDLTLRFPVNNSPTGSAIVFDYLHKAVLDGSRKQREVSGMHRYRFLTREGLIFGIEEGTVKSFLSDRGYRAVKDAGVNDLKAAYFTGINDGRNMVGGYGIVIGTV